MIVLFISLQVAASCFTGTLILDIGHLENTIMTRKEHEQIIRRLDRKIQKTRTAFKKLPSLQQKIDAKRQIRQLEQERDNYRLNFYELVTL